MAAVFDQVVLLRPLHFYLAGNSSWFLAVGIQSVLFSWLVTMVLHESPEMVGIAQMTMLLPVLILLLVGGGLADRHGGSRIAFIAQGLAVLPPLVLAVTIALDHLSYAAMLIYAATMGCLQAFVTPARDGLLNQVAGSSVQRTVMLASLTQFGCQIIGVGIAGSAQAVGAVPLLCGQAIVFLLGAFALRAIPTAPRLHTGPHQHLGASIIEGARSVWRSPPMRYVCVQNIAMGVCFMGSFIVTMPLLVREIFAGNAMDLSLVNGVNACGLASTIAILLRFGDLTWPGRTLLLSQGIGALVLVLAGFVGSLAAFAAVMFFWGVAGGFAMTMARTIVQELAPPDQRGRIMSFYGFTFTGAGPLGALLNGYLVATIGPQGALMTVGVVMAVVIFFVSTRSPLWSLRAHHLSSAEG
jgi:MFS family permease